MAATMSEGLDGLFTDFKTRLSALPRQDAQSAEATLARLLASPYPEKLSPMNILPRDDMLIRLQLINQIESQWKADFTTITNLPSGKHRVFTDHEFSALVLMDLGLLKSAASGRPFMEGPLASAFSMPSLVKLFLTKTPGKKVVMRASQLTPPTPLSPLPASASEPEFPTSSRLFLGFPMPDRRAAGMSEESDPPTVDAQGNTRRNKLQSEKRAELDDFRCLITGTDSPDIAHVFPFAANHKEEGLGKVKRLLPQIRFLSTMPSTTTSDDLIKCFGASVGCSDKKWNMISLSPTLHDYWGRAYFALKALGMLPGEDFRAQPNDVVRLRLQFHWLAKRANKKRLGRTLAELQQELPEFWDLSHSGSVCGNPKPPHNTPIIAAMRPQTGWPVEDGHIFYVKIQYKHFEKMKLAFDIQWSLTILAAMAGVADVLDDVTDEPDFLDENGLFPITDEIFTTFGAHPVTFDGEMESKPDSDSDSDSD